MGLKKILLGAAAATVLSAGVANAGFERDGWYFGLEGGAVMVNETQFAGLVGTRIEFDHGYGVLGTIGYAFKDSNWRMEGEVGFRENNNTYFGGKGVPPEGKLKEWTGMINAVYDIKMGSDKWGLAVGAGVGIDNPRLTAGDGTDSNDKVFAAQGIAGFTYRVNQHWDLVLNYRYLWVNQAELQASALPIVREVDLEKHTITVGFRYGYDEPPPPPPVVEPPAPPAQAKQFIIFFGFNKCNVTAEADAVLSEAASSAKSGGGASVRIVGHTDTSGSNAYNQKLSECRANAAKSNLVGKGVSEGSISTSGKGETELMVQTGDRVKEPQNRRATIDLN